MKILLALGVLGLLLTGCGAKEEANAAANVSSNTPNLDQSHRPGAPGMPPATPR